MAKLTIFLFLLSLPAQAEAIRADLPHHQLPKSKSGNLVVGNCDGETSIEIPGKREGQKLTERQARDASRQLMAAWKKKHPTTPWLTDLSPPAVADEPPSPSNGSAHQQGVYSNYTREDRKIWELEQTQLIADGKAIFHSGDKLGSKTAISCDMCHPNAANTHPETYPKFQVQLQRVAMLRDMINWCIENPVKGPMLRDEDPKMRALEAYILSQRRGVALDPGKH